MNLAQLKSMYEWWPRVDKKLLEAVLEAKLKLELKCD